MRGCLYFVWLCFVSGGVNAQTVTTTPSVPSPSQPVTITFDVTGTTFATKNLNDVWLWAWLEKGATDVNAPTNVNPATSAQDAAKVTRSSTNPNIYTITITATTFFNKPASEIQSVGLLLKGRDWANGQTADKFITFSENFAVAFVKPSKNIFFVNSNESIPITVSTNQAASIVLKTGSTILASSSGEVTELNYTHSVPETQGSVLIVAEATKGTETKSVSFTYVIRTATVVAARPLGIVDGINYSNDQTKATLSLWAPGKTSVFVLGDFNDWNIAPAYQMKKDGEHFWLEIGGLVSGKEYAFQYLVDESVKIADPYADKILDPDDQYIPTSTYPDLKTFPAKALSDQWYYNRLAVLQTGQLPYSWLVVNFQKPAHEKLVIYELLIRDFFENGKRNYQNLIDTVSYLKRLGVNAIELMPVMEFNGNESWGYNPTFMFAPDKYYGTKNKLKAFVDKCHQNGIAVILDIAMNHQDLPNPYVMMDFDFVNMKPEPDNKWFNVTATHPFSVFYDMNHESTYTKKYLDTVNYYWLNEYKVDGFRFDLSKGFTQTNNPNDVNAWSAYDPSRIAILKRMADKIWSHTPNAYVILEHLSVNTEEKELAEYRAAEGKGMMLWGKMTDQYNQNTMGYADNSDISGIYHVSRGWSAPNLVGYMESHDEERLMVKNLTYGNISGSYSVKDTVNALERMRAASTIFYTIPGPKMLWQFGELGYDYSINYCPNGSNSPDCRISPKPVRWDYKTKTQRERLFNHIRDLNRLRNTYAIFTNGTATISTGSSLAKQLMLKNSPYTASPANTDQMNAVVAVNFDLTSRNIDVAFPHTGTWYEYYSQGQSYTVAGSTLSVLLPPGHYVLFTDVPVENHLITSNEMMITQKLSLYPNPAEDVIILESETKNMSFNPSLVLFTLQGDVVHPEKLSANRWDVHSLAKGMYIAEVRMQNRVQRMKLIKR
jgi:1,4-alpha-glucan branching enzyme